MTFLNPAELDALLAAPDQTTWHGRRDHALLVLTAQTGLRVAELTALTTRDVYLGVGAHVSCRGKGRKDRCTPLTAHTVAVLTSWPTTRRPAAADPLFATRRGTAMSHDAVARLVAKHATALGQEMNPGKPLHTRRRHAAAADQHTQPRHAGQPLIGIQNAGLPPTRRHPQRRRTTVEIQYTCVAYNGAQGWGYELYYYGRLQGPPLNRDAVANDATRGTSQAVAQAALPGLRSALP
ncbi:tyrosine-type recombinase/integrase [Micromonospora deserti]|uniref:tyrosine-type recombinase/integrase n=1 Tax=Micromonospora deserti TaxID=2070366 RepID=UPI001314C4C3|nr:tyrosine-type recombinase/integrase [Micromonospora deserti]